MLCRSYDESMDYDVRKWLDGTEDEVMIAIDDL
jgi:hypothetical protein